jgi:hypothetical protein
VAAERLLFAAVLLAAGAPLAAAELGTLFHSPEERARLDRVRRGEPAIATVQPEAQALAPQSPEVTGFVRRSDGRNTVWIDGRPVATSSRKNDPLFDPRRVRDLEPDLPPSAVKVVPESRTKPAPR